MRAWGLPGGRLWQILVASHTANCAEGHQQAATKALLAAIDILSSPEHIAVLPLYRMPEERDRPRPRLHADVRLTNSRNRSRCPIVIHIKRVIAGV